MDFLTPEEDDPGIDLLLVVCAPILAGVSWLLHPWLAWITGDWSWRSWTIPALMSVSAALVAIHEWKRGGQPHPVAFPVLMAGSVLLITALLAWIAQG